MHSDRYLQSLDRAASQWGINPEYWDIFGKLHVATPDTKIAILRGLGVDTETEESLEAAVLGRMQREWRRALPPCLVISEAPPQDIYLCAPRAAGIATLEIRREDGQTSSHELTLESLPETGATELDGVPYSRRRWTITERLPLGYHDVTVRVGEERATMRLIVTPDRAWPADKRAAGIAIALYGLRSARNWGCGDFRDLQDFAAWVADELGASFIALNPLHAIHNRRPFNASPYLPNSVFYQNFLYIDVEAVPEFATSRRAQRLWNLDATQREMAGLRASEFVEYETVAAWKLRFLKLLFAEFQRKADPARRAEFERFAASEGRLLDRFATYCALDEAIHRRDPSAWIWPHWPAEYQEPESEATQAFAKRHWRPVMFYKWLQWLIDGQLAAAQRHCRSAGLSVGLYHDLALATDRFGSDLWGHREFFASGCRVGSPPDDFSPKGQDWGFPPPSSDQHRENGYRLFRDSIRRNLRHGGALRLDHVMRFFRLYWIPDSQEATEGAYVRDRYEDLVRILALESVRHRAVVVGEDLGTVEPYVRETLARFGILSYRLFYFERKDGGVFKGAGEYPEQALVSSTTHDLPTIAGFWLGSDIEARRAAGVFPDEAAHQAQRADREREKQRMLDVLFREGLMPEGFPGSASAYAELTGELHNAVIGFLARTPSHWMALNQEDLTKETHQQNLPGTTWQYPNWSRKMRLTVEELQSAADYARMFRDWLSRSGRRN